MLLRPLFFTSFLIDDQLDDEGLRPARADRDRPAPRARRRSPRPSCWRGARGWSWSASPRRAAPSSSRAWGSTAAPSPTTRSTRSSAGPPPSSTSPATARCAGRSTRTSATSSPTAWRWGSRTGRTSAAAADELPGPTPTFFFAPDRVAKRCQGLGRGGARAAGRRRLAPVLRVDRRLAGGRSRGQGFEARPARLPRGARGQGRAPESLRAQRPEPEQP